MTSRVLPLALVLATVAAPCAAQRTPADLTSARLAAPASAFASDAQPGQLRSPGVAARNRSPVLGALGGALVGGALTFLVSQVAWNDWDTADNADFSSRRMTLTLGGTALGALGGALLSHRSSSHAAGANGGFSMQVIAPPEIRQSTAVNAYDLVQALRPAWLRGTVVTSHPALNPNPTATARVARSPDGKLPPMPTTEAADPARRSEDSANPDARRGVRVYVERSLRGDVNSLRDIDVSTITSIEFLDTAAAGYRLGPGNPSGAIVVHITDTPAPQRVHTRGN